MFEALVIDWLKEASTLGVSRLMGLSWNAIDGIMQRAVERVLSRRDETRATQIGVDETAFRKRHELARCCMWAVIARNRASRIGMAA
jgi:transposase